MKPSWSKILFVASDTLLAAYLVFAFVSFDRKGASKRPCSKVNIEIADDATSGFIDAAVIKQRLQKTGCYPMGRPLCDIDTRRIEETLRVSPFVKTAECYKTEGGAVYVSVTQRMPVIRIKADNGDDYYVDDNDCIMPRSNYTSDLIIATGCISRWYATNYLSALGRVIMQNEMWRNLIEQINILPNHGVEIVPRIGGHIVYLGCLPDDRRRDRREKDIADFVERKMTRLEKFYRYGLSEVGWNKYAYISIEFDNQIICRKHGAAPTTPQPLPTTPQPTEPQPATDGPTEGEATEAQPTTNKETTQHADNKPSDKKSSANKPEDNKKKKSSN